MVDTFPQELPYSAIIKNKIQAVKRIPASSSLLTDTENTQSKTPTGLDTTPETHGQFHHLSFRPGSSH